MGSNHTKLCSKCFHKCHSISNKCKVSNNTCYCLYGNAFIMSMPPITLIPDHLLYNVSNSCKHEKLPCICIRCKCTTCLRTAHPPIAPSISSTAIAVSLDQKLG